MAYYKYLQFLDQNDHAAFDAVSSPGEPTPHSGIYRCEVCGQSVVSTLNHPLPPQNHHQHPKREAIRWRLVVATR